MFYFPNRKEARGFKQKSVYYHVVDKGTDAPAGKRWGVQVLNHA